MQIFMIFMILQLLILQNVEVDRGRQFRKIRVLCQVFVIMDLYTVETALKLRSTAITSKILMNFLDYFVVL